MYNECDSVTSDQKITLDAVKINQSIIDVHHKNILSYCCLNICTWFLYFEK